MTEEKIGQKEKITMLLAEYSSLRSEINARVSSSYQLLGIAVAAYVYLLQQPAGPTVYLGAIVVTCGAFYWGNLLVFEMWNAGRRVREIEADINQRAGDDKLLLWETERGGLTPGYLRKAFLSRFQRGGPN